MTRNDRLQDNVNCEVCGNSQGQCFEIHLGGERHVFDSFECAMRAFAPRCGHCGGNLVEHDIVVGDTLYCSTECAHEHNAPEYERRLILREQTNL
ncbi:MAG TPA: hypothetical protein VK909_04435 [Anaerolineales bacterium]|nr:hypothetical protein [Anaerolineales bacterium]